MFRRLRPDARAGQQDTPAATELMLPSLPLVQEILDGFELKHGIDGDGDLTVQWENCTMFVFFGGERGELLRIRAYLDSWSDPDTRTALALLLDEWNRTRALPKAFTTLPDEGLVGICAEHAYDFGAGATREQITFTVGFWVQTLLHFAEWVNGELKV